MEIEMIFVLKPIESAWDKLQEAGFMIYVGVYGLVVRAETEQEARTLCAQHSKEDWWLDPTLISCEPVDPVGQSGIILSAEGTG